MKAGPQKSAAFAVNRKATHDYVILQKFEAGMELRGSEVKSIRDGKVNLAAGFASVVGGELVLRDVHITPYDHAGHYNHEATRPRKLLLRAHELRSLDAKIDQMGLTIIPLRLYPKRRWIKIELGLCKGRKMGDKREVLRRKEADRETARAISAASRGR
ncbi:MAG: SsrA-binding protein SmpB [bacterium]